MAFATNKHMRLTFILVPLAILSSCERSKPVDTVPEVASSKAQIEDLPQAFSTYLDKVVSSIAIDDRVRIRNSGSAEEAVNNLDDGRTFRNGELNKLDSEVRKLLVRSGLFHPDDMSAIVLVSVVHRVRGEPVKFDDQVSVYRNFWAEQDCVAPTDVICPLCKQEMEVRHSGHPPEPGWVKNYFQGECPSGHIFWYYHTDGWRTTAEVEATLGEQVGGGNRE